MANPNSTFARFRPQPSDDAKARMEASRDARMSANPMSEVMDKVFRGEMTPEEGAAAVKKMMEG